MVIGKVLVGSGATEPHAGPYKKPPRRHSPTNPEPSNTGTAGNAQTGNQGGRADKGKGSKSGGRGAGGMSNYVQALVSAQIRAGVQDARKERRMVRREAGFQRRQAIKDNQRAQGDLNYIFGETGDYMNAMGQQIDQNYTDASARAAAAQQQLVQQLGANSQQVAGDIGGTLSQYGIGQMSGEGLQHDALMSQNLASQTGANNQANLSAQQQGAAAISALLQGMNAGSKMSQYGIQQNVLNDRLAEVYQNKRDGYNQVREAISDLRGSRGDLTLQMLQQLGGSPWAAYAGGGGSRGHRRSRSGSSGGYSSSSGSQSSGSSSGGKSKGNKGPVGVNASNSYLNNLFLGELNTPVRGK